MDLLKISKICDKFNITNYTINQDGSIDVNGNVDIHRLGLTELPLKFNRVNGHFYCSYNKLTTLDGSPKYVIGDFHCNNNKLTTLEYSPEYVGGDFDCDYNYLTDLKFSPKNIYGDFDCIGNVLTDNYCSSNIEGTFYTTSKQDGLVINRGIVNNYKEWQLLRKRKLILDKLKIYG